MTVIITPARKLIFIVTAVVTIIILLICFRVSYVKEQRRLFLMNYYDENEDNATIDEYLDLQLRESMNLVDYVINAKYKINIINKKQRVHNVHLLGPVRENTPIIVIHVHSNPFYFKELLNSLKSVMGINQSLLIFSHDYFDYDINRMIRDVIFAKYIQIFYPYSVQMHPKIFPGNDSQYCSEGFKCVANRNHRNPALAQRKLFWWWLLNNVFNRLDVTMDYNGTILFLEEDNIVTEDLIYVLKLLERILPDECPQCEILSLGAHAASLESYHIHESYAVIEGWSHKIKNLGVAFNRTVWKIIKSFEYDYCYFNDHSWDNSMRYIGSRKAEGMFLMLNVEGPRVFKIERCPNNSFNEYCSMDFMVQKITRYFKIIRRRLYPRNMMIKYNEKDVTKVTKTGSFGDIRDRELCMYFGILR